MKTKHLVASLLILFLAGALSGCAGMPAKTTQDLACSTGRIADMLNSGEYQKKVDNFIVVQDTTATMTEKIDKEHSSPGKLAVSKGLLTCMNNSLVEDMKLKSGIRVFGALPSEDGLVYGMTDYTKDGLQNAIEGINKTDNRSNIADGIHDAADDLKQVNGYSAVIILSDGIIPEKNNEKIADPVAEAAQMKKMYGDKVCIYTILLGNDPAGMQTMEDIAAQGECGFATTADNLYIKPLTDCETVNAGSGMADFVARVFLDGDDDHDGVVNSRDQCPNTPEGVVVNSVGCPIDSDKDGVPDGLDKCPDTPLGVNIDQFGCPLPDLDSDGDGVPDSRDKCPDTPMGIKVDSVGCPIPLKEKVSISLLVEFDFDKANVKFLYNNDIEKVASLLKAYPKTNVELDGYTDSIGTEEYNMELGLRRAESVKKYLVEKFGIDASRISTKSFGESMPVDTNDTPAGRQNNRRVVANIEAVTE